MAQLISGKALAAEVKQRVAQGVAALRAQGHPVCLRVFLVGDDPASATYVAGKERDCAECGITSQVVRLPADTPQQQLVAQVRAASEDGAVSGVLVQLPLPAHISEAAVIAAIAPHKDVDGFTPVNAGRMLLGQPCFVPCTPAGCLAMLRAANVPVAGRRAVVLGRSNIVGKPMALFCCAKTPPSPCAIRARRTLPKCAARRIFWWPRWARRAL